MKPDSWHASVRMIGCSFLLRLTDLEWRMRHGFAVEIIEARTGSLASLAEWLAANGYRPIKRLVGDIGREPTAACVRLVEVGAEQSASRLAALTRRGAGEHVAIAALVAEVDEASRSKALAIGPDDLMTFPFDEDELRIRLDALHQLGRARAVMIEQRATFARFAPPVSLAGDDNAERAAAARRANNGGAAPGLARRQPASADRPRVLVIGPASQHKVKVGEALARAAINYADNLEKAKGALDTSDFDMVVLLGTNAAARRDLQRWPDYAGKGFPATLLVLDEATRDDTLDQRRRLAQLPVTDRLGLPQPAELVRARMDFWLTFARLQRQLLSPPPGALYGLCHDALTGLFNHGFFLEHLKAIDLAPPHRRGMIVIELVNLARLNESAGHAAANRHLAALGPALRRNVRADDLPAYLGAGRFAVLLDDVEPGAATRIGRRLERLLDKVPHAGNLAPRLTARSFELGPDIPPLQLLEEAMRWRTTRSPAIAAA